MGPVQVQRPEATICTSPDSYVEARVIERLLERGVSRRKAEAIGAKVRRSYAARRLTRRALYAVDGDGA